MTEKLCGFLTQKKKACRFFANGCELEEEGCFFLREAEKSVFSKIAQSNIRAKRKQRSFFSASRSYSERPEAFIMTVSAYVIAQIKSNEVSF